MEKVLSERFGEAAAWAAELHSDHVRKGSAIPYVSHLFAVASLVLEDGGSEDEAIAALLHDSVEDDKTTLAEIESRFGAGVAAMVEACSDDDYTSAGTLRVSNADKVHNARCLLADYREVGEELWSRFNPDAQSADAQLWYYEELVDAFDELRPDSRLSAEFRDTLDALRQAIAAGQTCPACGGSPVLPFAYGLPGEELLAEAAAGKVATGGCIWTPDSPRWHCPRCLTDFGTLGGRSA